MAILMSIKPKYSRQIFSGSKKYELRKTPMRFNPNELVVVYESSPTKAVVGYFIIGKIIKKPPEEIWHIFKNEVKISKTDFFKYYKEKQWAYAIKVKSPYLYKERITLQKLRAIYGSWSPPQNFRYIKEDSERNLILKEVTFKHNRRLNSTQLKIPECS